MATINPLTSGAPTGNLLVDTLIWGGSWAPALSTPVALSWSMVTEANLGDPAPTQGLA